MAKITEKTKELLQRCKEAGYEKVTIFVRDKRVPFTAKIKDGVWFGQNKTNEETGKTIEVFPHKVVCGHPKQRESGWPKIWRIVKECGLTAGLFWGGGGYGDAHDIHPDLCKLLTAGYYEL